MPWVYIYCICVCVCACARDSLASLSLALFVSLILFTCCRDFVAILLLAGEVERTPFGAFLPLKEVLG